MFKKILLILIALSTTQYLNTHVICTAQCTDPPSTSSSISLRKQVIAAASSTLWVSPLRHRTKTTQTIICSRCTRLQDPVLPSQPHHSPQHLILCLLAALCPRRFSQWRQCRCPSPCSSSIPQQSCPLFRRATWLPLTMFRCSRGRRPLHSLLAVSHQSPKRASARRSTARLNPS